MTRFARVVGENFSERSRGWGSHSGFRRIKNRGQSRLSSRFVAKVDSGPCFWCLELPGVRAFLNKLFPRKEGVGAALKRLIDRFVGVDVRLKSVFQCSLAGKSRGVRADLLLALRETGAGWTFPKL